MASNVECPALASIRRMKAKLVMVMLEGKKSSIAQEQPFFPFLYSKSTKTRIDPTAPVDAFCASEY